MYILAAQLMVLTSNTHLIFITEGHLPKRYNFLALQKDLYEKR